MTTLDLSNHDLSTFDPACLRRAGVDRAIVGCWDLAASLTIVAGCRDEGIIVEDLYGFLYFGLPWEQREIDNALAVHDQLGGISRIWNDCEADPPHEAPGLTAEDRINATWEARGREVAAGVQPGIYSAPYYWIPKMANTRIFRDAGDPLWLPNYGSNDPANPRPPITAIGGIMGGWDQLAAHQYSSTINVCGRGRDHNYWFLGDEMSAEDRARLDRLEKLIAGNGIAKDPAAYVASNYDPALLTFGDEALAYAESKGWSAFLGVGLAQDTAAKAQAAAGAQGPDGVDHSQFVTRAEVEAATLDLPGD